MTRVILITGSELRHDFVRVGFSSHEKIEVLRSYCEGQEFSLANRHSGESKLIDEHIRLRQETERRYFSTYLEKSKDKSNPINIKKGDINSEHFVKEILEINPQYIFCYGCSLIKPKLINHFSNKIINVHLGLSPYYRGSGTNFWPLVENKPELIGATYMFLDQGIDTGTVIHQERPTINTKDHCHTIGCKVIEQIPSSFAQIAVLLSEGKIKGQEHNLSKGKGRLWKRADFTEDSLKIMHENLEGSMLSNYIENKNVRDLMYPIVNMLQSKESISD